ncbi:MAG: pentapeptide repeat-containing protein [Planctomycetaceae bacterium]|nr:pentapeptide repeat-containing protein [Planctomycetaceae bacterium]
MATLGDVLRQVAKELPQGTRTALRPLFDTELVDTFAERLDALWQQPDADEPRAPEFSEETTPPISQALSDFAQAMKTWKSSGAEGEDQVREAFVAVFRRVPMSSILYVLGIRTTPGSVVDERSFPPRQNTLVESASISIGPGQSLSVCGRALAKHTNRSEEGYWKSPQGSAEEQNELALSCLTEILQEATWWNMFNHFQQGLVYEVRRPSGHGARWSHDGSRFIGFVDPFDGSHKEDQEEALDTPEDVDATPNGGEFDPLPEHLTREELEQRYAAGQRNFQRAELSGENLQGLDLRGIDLTGADLRRCKVFRTNLENSNLTEVDLSGVYLAGTLLSGVTARRANFKECRMNNVKWHHVDLKGARLDNANFQNAELTSCNLRNSGMGGADFSRARLVDVPFYGSFLESCQFEGAALHGCRFNHARLSKADFTESRFHRCIFEAANFTGATLTKATFDKCDFVDADFTSANLCECNLNSAHFEQANMSGARLASASFNKASLKRANLSRADFSNADLSDCNLSQADLSRSDLRNCNLCGTILDGADLSSADVVDTRVDERSSFRATKTIGVDFGTNWLLRRQILDSAHELTIQHFCRKHPVLGTFWRLMLGCGKKNYLLLFWGVGIVFLYAGLMAVSPTSFDFGQETPTFVDHLQNSLAVFVTLDLAVDKGTDAYGRGVMLTQMLLSYLMLGFMASLFSGIFPQSPE